MDNIINPPEVNMTPKRGGFWKQLGMLVLTFGTAQLIGKVQRAKDRRLTALMVMSNIEAFAQQMDGLYAQSPVRIAVSDRQAAELRYDEDFWNQYNFVPVEAALLEKLENKLGRK